MTFKDKDKDKAKDLSFKANAKDTKIVLRTRPRPRTNITGQWSPLTFSFARVIFMAIAGVILMVKVNGKNAVGVTSSEGNSSCMA